MSKWGELSFESAFLPIQPDSWATTFRNSMEMNFTTQREDNNFLILIVTHAMVIIRSLNAKPLNIYQLQVDSGNQRDPYIEKSDWSSQRKLFTQNSNTGFHQTRGLLKSQIPYHAYPPILLRTASGFTVPLMLLLHKHLITQQLFISPQSEQGCLMLINTISWGSSLKIFMW